ncbi:MAG TPA: TIGR02234 family membrane protein [Mycobacterium sp.]|nr:TIGR02234 family membrane protein [Mycobacterium sp.]
MADAPAGQRRARLLRQVRLAQLLLVVAAAALWGAARLPWVVIRSADGLGPPRQFTVAGASWSTALLPLALLSLAAAVAAVAVRGRPLRVLAILTAAASLAAGYLAVSVRVAADVIARGAEIADVPIVSLVGSERHYLGASLTGVAAVCILTGAVLLMRSAAGDRGDGTPSAARYVTPAARRAQSQLDPAAPQVPDMSERMIWDALDEGCDPTQDPAQDPTQDAADTPAGPDREGR